MAYSKFETTNTGIEGNLSDIIPLLQHVDFDPETGFVEFPVDVRRFPVSAEHLHSLLHLSYECALTEQDEKLILTTGNSTRVTGDEDYTLRSRYSNVFLHTHPIKPARKLY
jgi:hypothetical protein